jgi:hypothetical protein
MNGLWDIASSDDIKNLINDLGNIEDGLSSALRRLGFVIGKEYDSAHIFTDLWLDIPADVHLAFGMQVFDFSPNHFESQPLGTNSRGFCLLTCGTSDLNTDKHDYVYWYT